MKNEYDSLMTCVRSIREKTDFVPAAALVLGSGLGGLFESAEAEAVIDYRDIEGFPVPTVPDHAGKLIFCYLEGVPTVIMQGRVHYYEGYTPEEVVRPVRVLGLLGAKTLILTNASGAINETFIPGDLMLMTDHILLHVPSPLRGAPILELGDRFPDMSEVYDPGLMKKIRTAAGKIGISLREGVYIQTSGPNYETKAEAKMFRQWGADAVGMSTAVEAVAAHHMGLRTAGISCVTCVPTDKAAGILTDDEVQAVAKKSEAALGELIRGLFSEFRNESGDFE